MTDVFRRVPYAPEPEAPYYHDAFNTASLKSDDEATRIKFAWWFVDNWAGRMTPADAWNIQDWTAILNSQVDIRAQHQLRRSV